MTTNILLKAEAETDALAAKFARALEPGDTVLLYGEIGAGKTSFCRSFIRHRLLRQEDVPSPTFTLVQTYDHPNGDIWHCDLYRLTSFDEVLELGLVDAFQDGICLVEWPEKLGDLAPTSAIRLHLEVTDAGHLACIDGPSEKLAFLRSKSE